jgi:hypothetical protein
VVVPPETAGGGIGGVLVWTQIDGVLAQSADDALELTQIDDALVWM